MDTLVKQQHELSLKNACVAFMFAYQQRNVERMLQCCQLDGEVNFTPMGDAGKGTIGELGKAIWTGLIDSFPDIDNTLDAAVAEDDTTVRCQVVIRGTQAKDFAGIISKGQHFDSDHIFVFRINDANKITSITVSWDHADFQKQLGA
jgi:ketosteroid isomerase-like protein